VAKTEPYFSHMPVTSSGGGVLQHPTRYLCAAAYLDEAFARKLIKEFVVEDHRGVVPSFGFDLVPVIKHALRARRMRLVRDTAIVLAVLAGAAVNPDAASAVLGLSMLVALVMKLSTAMVRLGGVWATWPIRGLTIGGVIVLLSLPLLLLGLLLNVVSGGSSPYSTYWQPEGPAGVLADDAASGDGKETWLAALIVLGAMIGAHLAYRYAVYRTLRELGPGSTAVPPEPISSRVRTLLERVSAAQRGNITLYSQENPFLGSGDIGSAWVRAWSIALELDRGRAKSLGGDREPGEVDPVELHRYVRERLVAMRDEPPPNERIGGLMVDWHVVARGECVQMRRPVEPAGAGGLMYEGHPLIDPKYAVPYSRAGKRAIEAIIRHPQADIRCYQRVTVATQGQAIKDADGAVVAPARYEDTLLSAFLYLAVEGRMLYAQFVVNVIPPIREEFRIVDDLPAYGEGMLLMRALRENGLQTLSDGVLGPFRLIRALWELAGEAWQAWTGRRPTEFLRYDYGARISVREEAAERDFPTFMQTLDADKYTTLLERRINEAVLDYLQARGIDVTAYREQADIVLNSPFIMSGGSIVGSQIAVGGAGSRIAQKQSRPKS